MVVAVRPEDIAISTIPEPEASRIQRLFRSAFRGRFNHRRPPGRLEITVKVMGISKIKMDEKIWLNFDPETLNLYDKESGNLISRFTIIHWHIRAAKRQAKD